jgi:hypothetical protein
VIDVSEIGVFMPSGSQDPAEDTSSGGPVIGSVFDPGSIIVVSIREGYLFLNFRKFRMPLEEGI